jgi:methylated-DNA-[protein]-cysteine S-methyltransferase
MHYRVIDSPIGSLTLVGEEDRLLEILLPRNRKAVPPPAGAVPDAGELDEAARQLGEYFAGRRRTFELRLDPPGGTEFQRTVWLALADIPYGETISYAELARRVGRPGAFRAVGAANGRNPLSIVLPCHRVIGADGTLVGFGGGLPAKRFLLALEGAKAAEGPAQARLPLAS